MNSMRVTKKNFWDYSFGTGWGFLFGMAGAWCACAIMIPLFGLRKLSKLKFGKAKEIALMPLTILLPII